MSHMYVAIITFFKHKINFALIFCYYFSCIWYGFSNPNPSPNPNPFLIVWYSKRHTDEAVRKKKNHQSIIKKISKFHRNKRPPCTKEIFPNAS